MNDSADDALRARLRRVLRAPAPPPAPASGERPATALPDWYLRRGRNIADAAPAGTDSSAAVNVGMPEGLVEATGARGVHAARVERLPANALHGSGAIGEVLSVRGEALARLVDDESLADFDPRDCTFLDIETTGLAGGAGTLVFQIGLLTAVDDGFELWQGFLRSPDEAAALLEACAERVAARKSCVSFFGKSFDRHRLEDQMRLHGVTPPFAGRPHLDLYHPCRALYSAALGDGRLATMEQRLCGVDRGFDLSGSFAPAAWFDFLAGRAHRLEAVFRHNRLDVLSLARLCAHLGDVLGRGNASEVGELDAAAALALARIFARRRDWPGALEWSQLAIARWGRVDASSDALRQAHGLCGRALDRLGRRELSIAAYERAEGGARDAIAAAALAELSRLWAREKTEAGLRRALDARERALALAADTLTGIARARVEQRVGHPAGPRSAPA